MAAHQDGDSLSCQFPQQRADLPCAGGIEPARGLVEEQQARRAQQCSGDAETLTHPRRVAAHPVVGAAPQAHQPEQLVDGPGRASAVKLG